VPEDHAAQAGGSERRPDAAHILGEPRRWHAAVFDELQALPARREAVEDGARGVTQRPETRRRGWRLRPFAMRRAVRLAGRHERIHPRRRLGGVGALRLDEQHRIERRREPEVVAVTRGDVEEGAVEELRRARPAVRHRDGR